MGSILQSLNRTVIAGIILAIVLFVIMYFLSGGWSLDSYFFSAVFRLLDTIPTNSNCEATAPVA